MKPSLLVLITALVVSVPVHARQSGSDAGPVLNRITEELKLNVDQANRLNELVMQHRAQMKSLRQQNKKQRSAKKELREQHRESLLTVLSHEQLYVFEKQMNEDRKQHHKRKHKQQQEAAE